MMTKLKMMRLQEQKVKNQNKEEEDLGSGKRRKSRNLWYFNQDTVNVLMSNVSQKNKNMNDKGESNDVIDRDVTPAIFEYIVTQYSLRQGLMKYGKLAEQATGKELAKIHKMDALQPLDPKQLTEEIASLINLTEKRDGTIKARKCADGGKQRDYMLKDESALPTVKKKHFL